MIPSPLRKVLTGYGVLAAAALLWRVSPAQELEVQVLKGHTASAYQIAFSPDGELVASTGFDSTIRIWSTADGSERPAIRGHQGKVLCLDFSPDGAFLVSGGEDRAVLLTELPRTGPQRLPGHEGPIRVLAKSPDRDGSRLATAGDDGKILVRDRADGAVVLEIAGLPARVLGLEFDPRGHHLVGSCADRIVRAWSLPDPPVELAKLPGDDLVPAGATWKYFKGSSAPPGDWSKPSFDDSKWAEGPSGFGYSNDAEELASIKTTFDDMQNAYVSAFFRKRFQIADPAKLRSLHLGLRYDDGYVIYLNGIEVARANVQGDPPTFETLSTSASSSSEYLPQKLDLTPHLKKLVAGSNVLAIQGHNRSASSSDFVVAPVLSAVLDETPEETEGKPGDLAFSSEDLGAPIRAIRVSPDGERLAALLESGPILLRSMEDGGAVASIDWPGGPPRDLAYLPIGDLVGIGADGTIRVWSSVEAKESHSVKLPLDARALCLAVSRTGSQVAIGCEDGSILLWKPVKDSPVLTTPLKQEGPVRTIDFRPDEDVLTSTSDDNRIRAWDVKDPGDLKLLKSIDQQGPVYDAVGQSGWYYSIGDGGDLLAWRLVTAKAPRKIGAHNQLIHAVSFSPDGRRVASAGSDKTIRIWGLGNVGRDMTMSGTHASSVYCLAFNSDGTVLASGGYDRVIRLWNVSTGAEIRSMTGHDEGVFDLEFEGPTNLISVSSDRSVRLWSDRGPVKILGGGPLHPGWVMGLRVTRDGRVLSADHGGNVLVWSYPAGEKLAQYKVNAIVNGFAASADGKLAATANSDGSCYLFRIPAGS